MFSTIVLSTNFILCGTLARKGRNRFNMAIYGIAQLPPPVLCVAGKQVKERLLCCCLFHFRALHRRSMRRRPRKERCLLHQGRKGTDAPLAHANPRRKRNCECLGGTRLATCLCTLLCFRTWICIDFHTFLYLKFMFICVIQWCLFVYLFVRRERGRRGERKREKEN